MVVVCTGAGRVAAGMGSVWAQERVHRITYPRPRPSAINCHPRRPRRRAPAPEVSFCLTDLICRPITCNRPMGTRNSPKEGGKDRSFDPTTAGTYFYIFLRRNDGGENEIFSRICGHFWRRRNYSKGGRKTNLF